MFINFPSQFIIFLISMTPIGELRASIPIACKVYNLPMWESFFWSVIGNMVPVFFIVFLLGSVSSFLSARFKIFNDFFEWLFYYTRKKHTRKFEMFKDVALILFVAVPLPVTGAWSGAVASFVFGIPPKKSLPLIFLGVLIAGVVVTFLTYGVIFR